jgi:hypothetical protein
VSECGSLSLAATVVPGAGEGVCTTPVLDYSFGCKHSDACRTERTTLLVIFSFGHFPVFHSTACSQDCVLAACLQTQLGKCVCVYGPLVWRQNRHVALCAVR